MLLNAWVDKLPEILAVVEQYSLHDCQGEEKVALQAMLDETFATGQRQQLAVSEVPKHLAAIQSICGRVSPMELQLFSTVKHCDAFFDFLKEKSFYDRCACLICWPVLYVDWPLMRPLWFYNETLNVEAHNATIQQALPYLIWLIIKNILDRQEHHCCLCVAARAYSVLRALSRI